MNKELMNNDRIGVAIIGLGFGLKVHMPAIRESKYIELVSVWHPDKDKCKIACMENNLKFYPNYNDLLQDSNIHALIITTPPSPRFILAKEALEAGKHLLLEKPAGLNTFEIDKLQKIAIFRKLVVAVDFEYRAVPIFMQTKKIIDSESIGNLWFIKLDWLMSSRADKSREWDWYSDSDQGGGVIGALGTHAFDIINWMFGSSQSIYGSTSTAIGKRVEKISNRLKKVTSEDIALANLYIPNNNLNYLIPAQINLSAVCQQGSGFNLEIYGESGKLKLFSSNQKDYVHGFTLSLTKNGTTTELKSDKSFEFAKTWSDGRIAPVRRIHSWWAKSIRSSSPIIPGLLEASESQKLCDLLKISAKSGLKQILNR
tara:strand:- start:65 stop:1177 length:1113 start_codon:yes stop_codon:yes gene_type:complete